MCSAPSLSNMLSQEVSPESLKILNPEIGQKRGRRAMTLAFGNFFPKFLEDRFSFREMEEQVSIEHVQTVCIHLCLHFHNSYLRWMAQLNILQMRKLKIREIVTPTKSFCQLCQHNGARAFKWIVLNVEQIFQGSDFQHTPRASKMYLSFEPQFHF